jgi:hypothetical protein
MPQPHPTHDISVRRIALAGGAIGGTVAVVIAAVLFTLHEAGVPAGGERFAPPLGFVVSGPQLQSAPQIDLARYRREKTQELGQTRWVDARHGVARIPIASAMQLLAEGAASAPGAGR